MKITRMDEAECYEPDEGWKRTSLCGEERLSVEHFLKPPGHSSPVHSHPHDQVLVVLRGALAVQGGDGVEETLGEGDSAFFPAGEAHRVRNPLETPSAGLDIFAPGRPFSFWTDRRQG